MNDSFAVSSPMVTISGAFVLTKRVFDFVRRFELATQMHFTTVLTSRQNKTNCLQVVIAPGYPVINVS